MFSTSPPYGAYTDIHGVEHTGTNNGEVFTSPPAQPACLQTLNNVDGMGEMMVAQLKSGAVGYVGAVTGAQGWGLDLNQFFFESLGHDQKTLGDMWNYMVDRFYQVFQFPAEITTPEWTWVAEFHQPWKYMLFGDPSLRVDGVAP